mgnify:CR=1 FL=1
MKQWLIKQMLLTEIPNDVILHALDIMQERKLMEVEVILSNGKTLEISLESICSILKHLNR